MTAQSAIERIAPNVRAALGRVIAALAKGLPGRAATDTLNADRIQVATVIARPTMIVIVLEVDATNRIAAIGLAGRTRTMVFVAEGARWAVCRGLTFDLLITVVTLGFVVFGL